MTFKQSMIAITASLQIGFFILMGFGLLIGSLMLYINKIDGGEWVTLCSVLFSVDRASHSISSLVTNRGQNDDTIT